MFENDVVGLTGAELTGAGTVGLARRVKSIFGNADVQDHDTDKGPWENDVVGAQAELAAAKYFNMSWTGMVIGNGADVGDLLEARAVWETHHRLIIRPTDEKKKHMPFVSVHAKDQNFHMRGWLFGHEAMLEKYLCDPTGKDRDKAWFVDNVALHPMKQLRDWVEKNRPKL